MNAPDPVIPLQRRDAGRDIAATCVQFGFCTSVCPTYVLDGEENDSPRGRIALIRQMLDAGGPPDPTTVKHIDRCLSCLSCTTTCAAGVNYRELVDTARDYIEASGVRPWSERVWRRTLAFLLTSPRLLSLGLRVGQPLLPALARRPGRLGALARQGQAPALTALRRRSVTVETPALATPSDSASTQAPLRRVALLAGCAQSALGPEIHAATRRLLARLGVDCVVPRAPARDGACCGALSLHLGYREQAQAMAAVWVDAWSGMLAQGEIDAIVLTTSGCGSVIRHYAELFEPDDPRRAQAQRVADHALDISECIARLSPTPQRTHRGVRVAYHDACSLKHGQRLTQPPRQVLKRLGFVVLEPGESHLCCGSAGTYNLLQPDIADRLGERKANHLASTRPDVIAAGNLGCLVQVSRFTPVPIAHWVQLVDWATGGPAPAGMEAAVARVAQAGHDAKAGGESPDLAGQADPAVSASAAPPVAPAKPGASTAESFW